MEIEFQDRKLELIETLRAHETKLPVEVIEACRDKLGILRSAADDRVLRNWKSLHYEKMKGTDDHRSIRLNNKWRLVFTIDTHRHPVKLTVLKVEDYH